MALVWLLVALAFGILEVVSLGFYAGFIVVGAVAAALAAQLGVPVPVQVGALVLVAGGGIVIARPPLVRYFQQRRSPHVSSGASEMIGQEALVVDDIASSLSPGHVMIMGENWPAVSFDGKPISAGVRIRVMSLQKATLVVAPATAL
ncbi:MAG: NfeD family protein [Candidatus Dormibacteria bacterium]